MSAFTEAASLPPITISRKDFRYLSARAKMSAPSGVSKFLKRELKRARIVDKPGRKVARLGSRVLYSDTSSKTPSSVILAGSSDADVKRARVSVLTSVGTALLGLEEGERIRFATPWGAERTLTVLKVDNDNARYDS